VHLGRLDDPAVSAQFQAVEPANLSTSSARLPRRHRGAQANQAHLPRGATAKTFLLAKTFRAPGTNFLRQEKSFRDHGDAAGPTDVIRRRASALMPHQSP
jgi:hypothetical protein